MILENINPDLPSAWVESKVDTPIEKKLSSWETFSASIKDKIANKYGSETNFPDLDKIIVIINTIEDEAQKQEIANALLLPADKDEVIEFHKELLSKIEKSEDYLVFSLDLSNNILELIGLAKSNIEKKKNVQEVLAENKDLKIADATNKEKIGNGTKEVVEIDAKVQAIEEAKVVGNAKVQAGTKEVVEIDAKVQAIEAETLKETEAFKQNKKLFQANYKLPNNLANIASYKNKLKSEKDGQARREKEFTAYRASEQGKNTIKVLREILTSDQSKAITDEAIFDLVRYQSRLRNKWKDLCTPAERASSAAFQLLVDSKESGIYYPPEDLVSTGWPKNYTPWIKSTPVLNEKVNLWGNQPTANEKPSLWNLTENFAEMNSKGMETEEVFTGKDNKPRAWYEDKKLLEAFPFPDYLDINDYKLENMQDAQGNIDNNRITALLNATHPIIENSGLDTAGKDSMKRAFVRHALYAANPTLKDMQDPDLSKWRDAWLPVIPNKHKDKEIVKKSEDRLIAFMRESFCGKATETFIAQEIKQGYVAYITNFLSQTPGLSNFMINPKDVTLTNDKVEIKLRITDDKWGKKGKEETLTIENGIIRITNDLRNDTDTHSNNHIKWGKVTIIGQMDPFTKFSEHIRTSITPDAIKDAVENKQPQATYNDTIRAIIQSHITNADKEFGRTGTEIAHTLSGMKVGDSMFDLMKVRHGDGEKKISIDKPIEQWSPFYESLRGYREQGNTNQKTIDKKSYPDAFDALVLIRKSTLWNSVDQNKILDESLQKLKKLMMDPTFINKVDTYFALSYDPLEGQDQDKDSNSTPRTLLLNTLNQKARQEWKSLAIFLDKMSDNQLQPRSG